jgi:hypothetical protein
LVETLPPSATSITVSNADGLGRLHADDPSCTFIFQPKESAENKQLLFGVLSSKRTIEFCNNEAVTGASNGPNTFDTNEVRRSASKQDSEKDAEIGHQHDETDPTDSCPSLKQTEEPTECNCDTVDSTQNDK